jgi:hypothetical protein
LIVTTVLVVLGFVSAFAFIKDFRAGSGQQYFYQANFVPAIMQTCGYGFSMIENRPQEMIDFIDLRSDSFSCESIKKNLSLITEHW